MISTALPSILSGPAFGFQPVSNAVLTTQQYSNGTWVVTVVSGEGQTRANLSVSYFDTEAEARAGATLIGAAYGRLLTDAIRTAAACDEGPERETNGNCSG